MLKQISTATREIHRANINFEKLAKNIDADRKLFLAYAKSHSRARCEVGPLVDASGNTSVLPHELAEELIPILLLSSQLKIYQMCHQPTDYFMVLSWRNCMK